MAIRATPNDEHYTHMVSLSDGITTIGLNVVNGKGEPEIRALQRMPYPRSTLAVGTASGQLSERRAPFGEFSRSDWSGGLGIDDSDKDQTRYWYASHVCTHVPGKVMLAPLTHLCKMRAAATNYPNEISNMVALETKPNQSVTMQNAAGASVAYAVKFTAPAGFISTGARVLAELDSLGAEQPTYLDMRLYTDAAGEPGVEVAAAYYLEQVVIGCHWYSVRWNGPQALAAGDCWLVILHSTGTTRLVCSSTSMTVKKKLYGTSSWAAASETPLFEVMNAGEWAEAKFYTYKDMQYLVASSSLLDTSRTPGTPMIWMDGYRGVADDNTGDLYHLVDNSATFTDAASAVIRVYETSNPSEYDYRSASSVSTTHTIRVTYPWTSVHSALTTEYVVEGSLTWNPVTGHGAVKFKDVAVTDNDVAYIAQGEGTAMRRLREYNNAGVWTFEAAADGANYADLLLPTYDQVVGHVVYRARNTATKRQTAKAPAQTWGTDLVFGTEVSVGGRDERITGLMVYDGKIAVLQSGSIWMVLNDVPDRLNLNLNSKNRTNGRNPEIVPPYMILPYTNGIERLYNSLLEDFGPERDNGLPVNHGGVAMDTETIPGGLLLAKDGGTEALATDQGTGAVYLYRNGGWHPVMELPWKYQPWALTVRRSEAGKDFLWVATKAGVAGMYWPREWDYSVHTEQVGWLEPDGFLITGWFDCGTHTLEKYWSRITLFADQLSATERITIYYQTEATQATNTEPEAFIDWTRAGATSGSGKEQAINLRITSRKIRFLIRLTGDFAHTPVLLGYNVEYLARVEASNSYPLTVRLTDLGVDRDGRSEALNTTQMINQIDAWAQSITPLTWRCIREGYDNKQVLIERPGLRPMWLDAPMNQAAEFASLTIIEAGE